MKLPRNLGANQLIKALRVLGYSIDHQRGSHIRIVTQLNGQHYETRITTQSPPIYSVLVNALGCSLGGKGCCGLQREK